MEYFTLDALPYGLAANRLRVVTYKWYAEVLTAVMLQVKVLGCGDAV